MKINEAKEVLKNAGYILDICWQKDDIRHTANELIMDDQIDSFTEDDLEEVVEIIIRRFDANYGLNWDFIKDYILEVKDK